MLDAYKGMEQTLREERNIMLSDITRVAEYWKGLAALTTCQMTKQMLEQGLYDQSYREVKAMIQCMEESLPQITQLLAQSEVFPNQLENDECIEPIISTRGENTIRNGGILSINYSQAEIIMQYCDDVVEQTDIIVQNMLDVLADCGYLLDNADELLKNIQIATCKLHHIENYRLAISRYESGIKKLEEYMMEQMRIIVGYNAKTNILLEKQFISDTTSNNKILELPIPGTVISISRGIELGDEQAVVFSRNAWTREYSVTECHNMYAGQLCCKRLDYVIEKYESNSEENDLLMFNIKGYEDVVYVGAMVEGFADIGDIVKVTLDDGNNFNFMVLDVKSIKHSKDELAKNKQCQCEWGHGYIIGENIVQLSICEFITAGTCQENSVQNTKSGAFLKGRYVTSAYIIDHIDICDSE